MKRQKKRILGLLGLVLVAITTIFAAFLPGPEASAANITTVTDNISVRVVGDKPDVNITSPKNGSEFFTPIQSVHINYENVKTAVVTVYYTDKNDVKHTYTLDTIDANYYPGEKDYPLDLFSEDYGYGDYVIEVTGDGLMDGKFDEDLVAFSFYPVYGKASEDESDGLIYLDLTYDTTNEEINKIVINVYDENGDLVSAFSPITVESPTDRVELPFADHDLKTGNYTIKITAYNADGEALYKPYVTGIYYETLPVPDTGGLFANLNISRADYLITGLLIFFPIAIFGLIFVMRGRDNKARAKIRKGRR